MSLLTCAGADVVRGRIVMPARGAWVADLVLATATAPSGSVTIAAAEGLTLVGTVTGLVGVHLDTCYLRVVGGAGQLAALVSDQYQRAFLRDPLGAIMSTSGETQSPTIGTDVLAVPLSRWTIASKRASAALDDLAAAAGRYLGSDIRWRVLDDGQVWMGAETWPAASLHEGDVITAFFPDEARYEIAAETPTLKPGVSVDEIGNVAAVEHWIAPAHVRSWAWK